MRRRGLEAGEERGIRISVGGGGGGDNGGREAEMSAGRRLCKVGPCGAGHAAPGGRGFEKLDLAAITEPNRRN